MRRNMHSATEQLIPCSVHAQNYLIESLVSFTSTIVNEAMNENWEKMLDIVEERRQVLDLVRGRTESCCVCVDALGSAIEESERAVMRVVAHAIVEARAENAAFSLYG